MTIRDVFGVPPPKVASFKHSSTAKVVNPDLVIGMELETENCAFDADTYLKLLRPVNFGATTDGSLRGNAYEFISKPMRSEEALPALTKYFELTKFTAANYSDRCSVHVHVNCTDLEPSTVANVAILYTLVEEILFTFVGGNRDSNIYCIPWNQCRSHLDLVRRFLDDPGSTLRRWSKYTALNLLPLAKLGTIEFRQMHGTADIEKLTTWVNLIGSLFKVAKEYELNDLIAEVTQLNSNSHYEAFFNRMVSGLLPYDEVYRPKMEEGVIFAKYSLISMNAPKKPTLKAATTAGGVVFQDVEANALIQNPAAEIRWDALARAAFEQNNAQQAVRAAQVEPGLRGWRVAPQLAGFAPPPRPLRNRPVPRPNLVDDAMRAQIRNAQLQQEAARADLIAEIQRNRVEIERVRVDEEDNEGNF